MSAPLFQDAPNTVAGLTSEVDLLASGGTAGRDTAGVDTILINIRNSNTSNAATIKIYTAASDTGTPAAWSQTYSVAAKSGGVDGTKQILIRGYRGGNIRVTGSSTTATLVTDISGYTSPNGPGAFQVIVDGVVQGGGTGGTISGNLSQSGGTISLSATGTAALDSTGAMTIGATSSSIAVGSASVVANFVGGLTIASAKAITGLGNLAVESASGSTLTVGAASNAVTWGQAAKLITTNGDILLNGNIRVTAADAGAAASSGTASAYSGTFTVASGQTTYTLTNAKILSTSLLFVTCISGAVARQVNSFIPNGGGGSAVLTLSGAAGADSKFAFLVVNV
jgi:hypothetical protein